MMFTSAHREVHSRCIAPAKRTHNFSQPVIDGQLVMTVYQVEHESHESKDREAADLPSLRS